MATKAAHVRAVHWGDQLTNAGQFAIQVFAWTVRVLAPLLFFAAAASAAATAMQGETPELVIAVEVFAGLIAGLSVEGLIWAISRLLQVPEVGRDDR